MVKANHALSNSAQAAKAEEGLNEGRGEGLLTKVLISTPIKMGREPGRIGGGGGGGGGVGVVVAFLKGSGTWCVASNNFSLIAFFFRFLACFIEDRHK